MEQAQKKRSGIRLPRWLKKLAARRGLVLGFLGGLLGLVALIVFLPARVWGVIGWVFLALLGLFVLLMACPLVIGLRYEGGVFRLWVRILFIKVNLLPAKPRPEGEPKEKKKKEPAKKKEEPEEEEPKESKPMSERIALIKRLAKAGLAAMGKFFRHLRINRVEVVLPIHAEDASDTAVRCGQAQMAIGTLRAVLDGRMHVRYRQLEVFPDFAGQNSGALKIACQLAFCPGILFVMGFTFLRVFIQSRRPYSKKAYKRAIEEKRKAAEERRKMAENDGKAA